MNKIEKRAFELTCGVHNALGLSDSFLNIRRCGDEFESFKYKDTQKAFEFIKAYLETNLSVVPEGWRLVPIKPTQAMLDAAWEYHGSDEYQDSARSDTETDAECYESMINASPVYEIINE